MIESLGLYYRLLAKYLTPQRPRVVALAVVLLTGIGLQIQNPLILRYFIDAVGSGQEFQSLAWVALLFIVVAIVIQASFVLARYLGEHVAWAATNAMRSDLALHCLRLDISFHHAHTPGELTQRVDGDVTRLADFFSQFVILVVGNLLLLTGVLIMLMVIDWRVSVAFAVLGAATLAALVRVQKEAASGWAEHSRVEADWYGFVEERISASEDIRTLGAIPYVMQRFESTEYYDTLQRAREAVADGSMAENLPHIQRTATMTPGVLAMLYVLSTAHWLIPLVLLAGSVYTIRRNMQVEQAFIDIVVSQTPLRRRRDYWRRMLTERDPAAEMRLFGLGQHFVASWRRLTDRPRARQFC